MMYCLRDKEMGVRAQFRPLCVAILLSKQSANDHRLHHRVNHVNHAYHTHR